MYVRYIYMFNMTMLCLYACIYIFARIKLSLCAVLNDDGGYEMHFSLCLHRTDEIASYRVQYIYMCKRKEERDK